MTYLTNAQFVQQSNGAFSGVDAALLTQACAWASGQANMYLSKRYMLPLVSFGDDLTMIVYALALWKIATQQGFRPGSGQNEVIRLQYEDAIKQLNQIGTGDLTIDCVDSSPEVDEEGSLATSGEKLNFHDVIGRRGNWGC